MNAPKVSVIMRSKNCDWVIAQALAALYSQTWKDFELLVVDSGSTDRTLEIVRQYPCRLLQIPATSYQPGPVLNMAITEAAGEIIVFQNSDTVPLSQYTLERLIAAFDDPEVGAAFGRQVPRPEAVSWVRRDYDVSFPESGSAPPWIVMSLPLAALRKSVWEQRPFYQDAWASEDTEWGNWAKKKGYKVQYVADAVVMHSHNYTIKEIYRRRFVEGEADVFIYSEIYNIGKMLRNTLASVVRDFLYCLKRRDLSGMFMSVPRRLAYHWGYYAGYKWGNWRQKTANQDVTVGQKIVLPSYNERKTS